MCDDYDRQLRQEVAEGERGTWREALRSTYAPWFAELDFGFQCGDGWQKIISDLTSEIAVVVGGTENAPDILVVQVKEKLGGLRFYIKGVPQQHRQAVSAAIGDAEEKSFKTCESCGAPGRLRRSRLGYIYTACAEHVVK